MREQQNYECLLDDFKQWQNKDSYLELIKEFLNKEIAVAQFVKEYFNIWKLDRDRICIEIPFRIGFKKVKDFSSLMFDLFIECDMFEADESIRDNSKIGKEGLRSFVKYVILNLRAV